MSPLVTIGLPVHNGEKHVGAAIESILTQTVDDLVLVVSDNASTDATGVVCKEFAAHDDRVRYVRRPTDIGGRANFHATLDLAPPSPYFKWAGHDDLLEPTFLERCLGYLDATPRAVLCQTLIRAIDGDDRPLPSPGPPIAFDDPTPHERLRSLFAQPKTHQTLWGVMRRDVLERTGKFGSWYTADRGLLTELSLYGGFGRVDEVLFVHREHEGRGDYMDDENRIDWYLPERNGKAATEYWPHLRALVRILATTPMPPAERALCAAELARRAGAKLHEWPPRLTAEAVAVARAWNRRRTTPPPD
jgi:glycosyltransferase involved in cell wall biosynthesis